MEMQTSKKAERKDRSKKLKLILAEKLYNARKEKKLSQQDVANETGISIASLRQYETGNLVTIPTVDTLIELAKLYEKPLSYFVGDVDTVDTFKINNCVDIAKALWKIRKFLPFKVEHTDKVIYSTVDNNEDSYPVAEYERIAIIFDPLPNLDNVAQIEPYCIENYEDILADYYVNHYGSLNRFFYRLIDIEEIEQKIEPKFTEDIIENEITKMEKIEQGIPL